MKTTIDNDWYEDFPKENLGGGNPYQRCVFCKKSVPEINYSLKGHSVNCQYRQEKSKNN
jgi:recombinational DNA repair protein (RecF pathway)